MRLPRRKPLWSQIRRSEARMSEQELDHADVDAPLEQMRGETVTQRVRPERRIKAAGGPRLLERGPRGGIGQMGRQLPAGKEPLPAMVDLPDVAEHLEDRFGQGENTLLVSLADHAQNHPLGVDRGGGESDGLGNAQAVSVD